MGPPGPSGDGGLLGDKEMQPDRRDDFELRSLDFLGDEQELRAAALADLAAAGGRNYRAPRHEEAADSTNSVRVAVDQKGSVTDVNFRSDWRSELVPQRLGTALLEAHKNATSAMMNALALASLAEEERAAADGDDDEPRESTPLPEAPEPGIAEIWRMLSDVEDMMYRAEKLSRQAPADRVRTVYSPYGHFHGTCDGRTLTSITAELTLVQQADSEQLRSAALELFRQAENATGRENL